jgi:chemotaxis protein MotB
MIKKTIRPKKIKIKKGEALWLLSFSDLSMILISFFVMLLANAHTEKQKVERVKDPIEDTRKLRNLSGLQHRIESEVKKQGLQASAQVTVDANGLSVEFKDSLLFGQGSAASNPKFAKVVGSVMNVIAGADERYDLILEGHTDDTRVVGGLFPSNWELSAARGITLMRQFEKRGVDPKRMYVKAFADTRPKVPIAGLKGAQLAQARAANRRVVIRIE